MEAFWKVVQIAIAQGYWPVIAIIALLGVLALVIWSSSTPTSKFERAIQLVHELGLILLDEQRPATPKEEERAQRLDRELDIYHETSERIAARLQKEEAERKQEAAEATT